jgi:hypothetical protein
MVRPFLAPFRRLLRLAGSRRRYSTPPPHGFADIHNCILSLFLIASFPFLRFSYIIFVLSRLTFWSYLFYFRSFFYVLLPSVPSFCPFYFILNVLHNGRLEIPASIPSRNRIFLFSLQPLLPARLLHLTGISGFFSGCKAAAAWIWLTHLHLMPTFLCGAMLSLPHTSLWRCS